MTNLASLKFNFSRFFLVFFFFLRFRTYENYIGIWFLNFPANVEKFCFHLSRSFPLFRRLSNHWVSSILFHWQTPKSEEKKKKKKKKKEKKEEDSD